MPHVAATDVVAIGITNQRETTVVWDRVTGEPISPAVVWQSRASADICERLKADGLEPLFRERTGLLVDAYFSGTKIRWLLDRVPDAQRRAEAGELLFGTIDTWLIWKLTDGRVHCTDVSNAARTLIFNIHTFDWDDELLRVLNVPRTMLPTVQSSSEVFGETRHFGPALPIAGIAGDQQAALFGQACFEPSQAKNTYGTGCFLLVNAGERAPQSADGLLSTLAWRLGDRTTYALEGSAFVTGAAVQWLRDGLGLISDAAETDALASSVADNGGVYLVPAFVGLGAPHWDMYARGLMIGLTRGSTRAHVVRATLESIAFQSRDLAEAMARRWTAHPGPEGRRRWHGQSVPHAVSGRSAGGARRSGRHAGDDGAGRRRAGGTRRRPVVLRRTGPQLARRAAVRAQDERRSTPIALRRVAQSRRADAEGGRSDRPGDNPYTSGTLNVRQNRARQRPAGCQQFAAAHALGEHQHLYRRRFTLRTGRR